MNVLILVDIQNDFMPGGALGVPEGDKVVAVANRLMPHFDTVAATQDFHPANHRSFASRHPGRAIGDVVELVGLRQILWPDHCVEGSSGVELVDTLDADRIDRIIRKGTRPEIDSYSGFFDNGGRHATELDEYLKRCGATDLYIMGLATDYCVKFSAMDARRLGYKTTVVVDGCRGVDLSRGDVDTAIREMTAAGVRIRTSDEVIAEIGEAK